MLDNVDFVMLLQPYLSLCDKWMIIHSNKVIFQNKNLFVIPSIDSRILQCFVIHFNKKRNPVWSPKKLTFSKTILNYVVVRFCVNKLDYFRFFIRSTFHYKHSRKVLSIFKNHTNKCYLEKVFTNQLLYDIFELYNHVFHDNDHNLYIKLKHINSFDQEYSIYSIMICLNWIQMIKICNKLDQNKKNILEIIIVILLFTITSKINIYDNQNRNIFITKLLKISKEKITEIFDSINYLQLSNVNKQLLLFELIMCKNKLLLIDTKLVY